MTDYFDHYIFTSSVTNFVCPAWLFGHYTWSCPPPNACATDPSTSKQYCCNAGDVCWTPSSVCASDGSTFTCSSGNNGSYTWCCLKNKEACTQLAGQINICYSLAQDTLNNISISVLNGTYSSLSSAQPSASSYAFDPLALIAQTQTTSTQTVTATNAATSTARPSNANASPNSLSGGAIAAIVVSVMAAIAIAGVAVRLFMRHRQRKQNGLAQAAVSQADPKYAQTAQEFHGDSKHMPQEMQADNTRTTELPGTWQHYSPQELPTTLQYPPQS